MFGKANPYNLDCPSRDFLELAGGKWTVLLLCALRDGAMRTGDLKRRVGGISQKMLSQTLKALQFNGLVERTSYGEVPPRVEYQLTELGHSLSELAAGMEHWVVSNYPAILQNRGSVHAN